MRNSIVPVAAIALAAASPAWAAERSFELDGFSEVAAGSGLDVEIVQGGEFAVVAEGSPRGLKRLQIDRRGNRLVIEREARGLERFSPLMQALSDEVVVRVTLPELTAVTASAGSDVSAEGSTAGRFTAEASSGADLEIAKVAAETVTLAVSSGADLDASGTCGTLTAEASSGADLDARGLVCDVATATASSGSDISLTAGEVRAEAQSGADVDVWGAEVVEAEESSGGDVSQHR